MKIWIPMAACLLATVLLATAGVVAQEELPGKAGASQQPIPATDARHYSYAIGLRIGSSFHQDEVPLDAQSLLAGLHDGLSGAQPKFDQQTCKLALKRLSELRMQTVIDKNRKFLELNSKAEGVHVLPSGLQYKVLQSGDGPTPTATDVVKTHYRGQLIDGTEFDSSYARHEPAVFPVGRVIPGWTEALQKMKVGDKWQLFVPSKLAYGAAGAGDAIPPHATLIFEVELLGIEGKAK